MDKDRSPPPRRTESRRLVQGGREETGGIPLEQRAELTVGPSGPPPLPGGLERPERLRPGKKSGTAEGCAFVSLLRQRRFILAKTGGNAMNCPKCGKPMEEGFMHTRNYPFWTQQELRFFRGPADKVELGPPGDDTTSVFTRDPFPEFPHTMLCRKCNLVTFPCHLIEKSTKDPK